MNLIIKERWKNKRYEKDNAYKTLLKEYKDLQKRLEDLEAKIK